MNVEDLSKDGGSGPDDKDPPASAGSTGAKPRGRSPLPAHLKRERIVHDLAEVEKHCHACDQDLREFGEETSERYPKRTDLAVCRRPGSGQITC